MKPLSTTSKVTCTLLALVTMLVGLWGCQGNKLYEGADARVAFSQDTVLFDTVFSTIGSASGSAGVCASTSVWDAHRLGSARHRLGVVVRTPWTRVVS